MPPAPIDLPNYEFKISLDLSDPLLKSSIDHDNSEEVFELGYYIVFRNDVEHWCQENLEFEVECVADFYAANDTETVSLIFGSAEDVTAFNLKWI